MAISLRNPRLSLEDRMDLVIARTSRESRNPPIIGKREFFTKIIAAARQIGIASPKIYEWDRKLVPNCFTDGCLREEQFMLPDREMHYSVHKDIGYFNKNSKGRYTIRSFEINDYVFSDQSYQRFHRELEKNGLRPTQHHRALAPAFYTDAEVEAWKTRTLLYR